ncbi:MAG: ketopantoate reductase family protein [bacterium]
MKILIVGAGAIGSVIGGFLFKAGYDVALIGRGEHIQHIKDKGLNITGIWGDHKLEHIKVIEPADILPTLKFDVIILSVKSYDTLNAIQMYSSLLANNGVCVSFQNGLGNMEKIASVIGADRTAGARVIFGAEVTSPGTVNVTVYADQIVIGPFKQGNRPNKNLLVELAEIINTSNIPAYYTDDVYPHLWAKMFYNCPLNPLSAIFKSTYGALIRNEYIVSIMNDVVREAHAVAKAMGVNIPWRKHTDFLELFYTVLVPATADHKASMLQDIERGKRTEIDAINGAVVSYGRMLGISTDVNSTLVYMVKAMEQHYYNSSSRQS